jgi:uncharacterized protein YjbI with pentapeptide repeats
VLPGLAAVIALIFTSLSIRATDAQLQITEQGQITDRYNAAISNLGSPSVDVRLGGIYALQRIMQDSFRDQPTVVAVLCAFVRDRATAATVKSARSPASASSRPPTDIQAALTVVISRNIAYDDSVTIVDLTDANLTGAYLVGADLTGANLVGADLTGAGLTAAHLNGANLNGADLNSTYLRYADLSDAFIRYAHLVGAHLDHAHLKDADLSYADLRSAGFAGADLTGAELNGADLTGADLTGADLNRANLIGVKGLRNGAP